MKKLKVSKNRTKKFGANNPRELWNRCRGECEYCGIKLVSPGGDTRNLSQEQVERLFTLDHVIPTSKGGRKNDINNLKASCNRCNNIKGNYPLEFLRMRLLFDVMGWPQFSIEQYCFLESRGIILSKFSVYRFNFEKEKQK